MESKSILKASTKFVQDPEATPYELSAPIESGGKSAKSV